MMSSTFALLGYGRFGAAFTDMLQAAGHTVRVFDPKQNAPQSLAAASPTDAVKSADYIILAMPVPFMRDSIAAIRDALVPTQMVLDVGSVKVHPFAAMQAVLGNDIPFVGTHPLFGPISLERDDKPRRVVICPAPAHLEAAQAITELFHSLDCETIELDPKTHDRAMARTHAMAFFIAKGLLEFGVDDSLELSPPSFQGVHRMLDAVRGDAGHLFAAIQRQNPYSAEAREDFLQALAKINADLETNVADDSFNIPEGHFKE